MGDAMQCPQCATALPDPRAKFCPRCGAAITGGAARSHPPTVKPVHIEKRGTLWNPFFIVSVIFVVAGGLLAGHENFITGGALLAIGIPALLIATVRSLSRR